jgi:hypothetical protein
MIKFVFAAAGSSSSSISSSMCGAMMVYSPGQDYVMFNGLKIQLDRVLDANQNWVGCMFCPHNRINFIECNGNSSSNVKLHSAEIVSSSTVDAASLSGALEEEEERRVSSMRVRQAAVLLKAAKRASESVGDIMRLIKLFDREAGGGGGGRKSSSAKLGIVDFLRKRRGAVSFQAMERTLQMVEDESIEIMHEELDLPPLKRLRHH